MKQLHRVLVEEKYSKWVEVATQNGTEDEIEAEIRDMMDNGEIEMSEPEDYDGYSIVTAERMAVDKETSLQVSVWARATIGALAMADPKEVACMTAVTAMELLERLRDEWVDVPPFANSEDLLDAARLYRDLAEVRR